MQFGLAYEMQRPTLDDHAVVEETIEQCILADEMGFDYIEGGYPLSNEKDEQFFQRVRQLGLQNARLCGHNKHRARAGGRILQQRFG